MKAKLMNLIERSGESKKDGKPYKNAKCLFAIEAKNGGFGVARGSIFGGDPSLVNGAEYSLVLSPAGEDKYGDTLFKITGVRPVPSK